MSVCVRRAIVRARRQKLSTCRVVAASGAAWDSSAMSLCRQAPIGRKRRSRYGRTYFHGNDHSIVRISSFTVTGSCSTSVRGINTTDAVKSVIVDFLFLVGSTCVGTPSRVPIPLQYHTRVQNHVFWKDSEHSHGIRANLKWWQAPAVELVSPSSLCLLLARQYLTAIS